MPDDMGAKKGMLRNLARTALFASLVASSKLPGLCEKLRVLHLQNWNITQYATEFSSLRDLAQNAFPELVALETLNLAENLGGSPV